MEMSINAVIGKTRCAFAPKNSERRVPRIAMPFGRRYELERLKKNCRRENTSPGRNSARLWTAAVLCRFPFANGMRVKLFMPAFLKSPGKLAQSLARHVLNPLVAS
jgi:hypothetical protein